MEQPTINPEINRSNILVASRIDWEVCREPFVSVKEMEVVYADNEFMLYADKFDKWFVLEIVWGEDSECIIPNPSLCDWRFLHINGSEFKSGVKFFCQNPSWVSIDTIISRAWGAAYKVYPWHKQGLKEFQQIHPHAYAECIKKVSFLTGELYASEMTMRQKIAMMIFAENTANTERYHYEADDAVKHADELLLALAAPRFD